MKINHRIMALLAGAALVLLPLPAQSIGAASAQPVSGVSDDGPGGHRPGGQWRGGQPGGPQQGAPPQGGRTSPAQPGQQQDALCRPGTPPNAPPTTAYHDDNPLLGPAELPTANPVGPLLAGYQRFGALTAAEFLAQYGNATRTAYVYPPADGFVIGPDGRPIKAAQTLLPGYRLDRFGFPGGAFLAPLGTPFSARSLPPSNLNTPQNAPLANYHTYCVVKPFAVDSGPIAPWFAQPGMGTQFKLNPAHLPQAGSALSITWLLTNGYLVEENLTAAAPHPCGDRAGVHAC